MAKTRGTLKFYDMNSPEIEATTAGQQTEYKGRKGRGTLTFTEIEPIPMPETTVKPETEEDAASGGGAQKDNKKFDAGQYAGDAGRLFLNGVAEGFAATGAAVENWIGKGLDKLFPGAGFEGSGLFNVLYNGRPDWKWAGENGLVGIKQDREYNQESLQENADRIDSKVLKKAAEFGGDIAYGLGNAAPMAATAMATGGASAAASLTKEGLMKTGAEVVEKSGVLNSLSQAAREMLTSQDYWTSFASEVGMDYYDALDNGATEDEALRYALSSAGLNSVIEIGGGIQKIPEKPTFKTWLKSAHEEGMEEIQQGVVSRLLENVVYKKGNPIASVTDENAVFNPVTALGEYAGGAAVGGILSGGQQLAQRGINDAQYRKAYGNNAQALVDESLELNPDNELAKKAQKKLDAGKKLTGSELRQLVEQNEIDMVDGDRAAIQTAAEARLTELGETENVPQVAEAIARQAAGERITDAEKTLLEGSERAQQVRQELNPENIRVGATDEAWTGQIGTERVNRAAYNRGIQENGVTGAKYNAETGKLDAIVKDDAGKIKTVPAEKAELSPLQEELFDWAADLGEAGPVLVSAYREHQNLETYARQFHNAYEYGKAGVPMDYVNKSQAVSRLNTTQREIAYEEGAKAHQRELQGRQEKKRSGGTVDSTTQKKPTVSLRGATVGGVKYAPVNKKAMDGRQWASVGTMKAFAQATGVNVVFYESQANDRGEYEGANGFYKDGTLYLDINAGRDRVAMGETAILKTAAHEITHYIKDNTEQYEILKNFVVEKLTQEEGVSFDDLVTDKQRREPGLSYEEAVDEVVADACEMMLKDSKAVEQLARENRSLAERIRQWIRKWVRSLKAAMEGLTADRPESRAMMQYAQELQEIWDNALVDAARNGRRAESKTRYSYSGVRAKTANRSALQKAVEMRNREKSNEEIRKETGWFVGMDGKWRFEISDADIRFDAEGKLHGKNKNDVKTLADYISHEKLFEAYPDLAEVPVYFAEMQNGDYGTYSRGLDEIALNRSLLEDPKQLLDTLVHEVQHAIQERERFSPGASLAYWNRRLEEGADVRTQKEKQEGERLQKELDEMKKSDPEFVADMEKLNKMAPSVSRGAINWDTLEQIEPDPPEWVAFDRERDRLEEKYGDRIFDWFTLQDQIEMNRKKQSRMPRELYYNTAGEIEARDSAARRTLTEAQRKEKAPNLGNDNTVFAESGVRYSVREVGGETMPVLNVQNDTRNYKVAEAYLKTLVDTEHPFSTILVDAQPVYIGKDLPGEYRSSEYTKSLRKATRAVKMQAVTNLDEMLLLAENGEWQENVKTKHKRDAKNGWYRYSTRFALPVLDIKKAVDHYTVYSGTLLIRNDADGKSYLYDLLDIKKEKVISSTSFSARERSEVFEPKPSQQQYMRGEKKSQGKNIDKVQNQQREHRLSDRVVLDMAAEMALRDQNKSWTAEDREQLERFRSRMRVLQDTQAELEALKEERKVLLAGRKVSEITGEERTEVTKNKNRIDIAKNKAERYEAAVWELESKAAIKTLLRKSRSIVETEASYQARKEYRERQEEREMVNVTRRKVERNAKRLLEYMNTNTDKKHIPEALKKPIGEMLESLNFYSNSARRGGYTSRADMKYYEAMQGLQAALAKQRAFDDTGEGTDVFKGYLDLPAGFESLLAVHLERVKNVMEKHPLKTDVVRAMDLEDLRDLDVILSVMSRSVTKMNEMFIKRRFAYVADAAEDSIIAMHRLGQHQDKPGERFALWDNTLPWYAFQRFGEGGKAVFEGLQDGWDKLAFNMKTILDFRQDLISDALARKWDTETHKVELTDPDGAKVTATLTTAQLMSLRCLSKRKQALGHLLGGGIRPDAIEITNTLGDKIKKKKWNQDKQFKLTEESLGQLLKLLTPEQIKVADAMQKFMTEQGSAWGNAISMARFGYRAFTEQNYFPIETDRQDREAKTGDAKEGSLYRLQNISAVKPLVKDANNALILRGIFDVFANHTADMAKYNALVLPIIDAQKWYNYRYGEKNEAGQVSTRTVQRAMTKAYGEVANNFVIKYLQDLNGVKENGDRGDTIPKRMISNYKRAMVAANMRVAILQPTAYARASAVLDYKYLAKAFADKTGTKQVTKEMLENSGIALWKSLGFFDTDVGRSIRDQIKGKSSKIEDLVDKTMVPAEKGDEVTWARLWRACKLEVQDKQHLTGEELLKATAERFREVVYRTQVVDSTMTRSHAMRGSGTLTKMATSFMSEPTVSYNMVMESTRQIAEDAKRMGLRPAIRRNWKTAGRAYQAYIVSAVVTAIVESLYDALRDSDDDKYLDKVWKALGGEKPETVKDGILDVIFGLNGNLAGDINPIGKVPYLRDVVSILGGYSNGRMDTEAVANLKKAIDIWDEVIRLQTGDLDKATKTTYYGNMTTYGMIYPTAKALSQLTGLPGSAAMREVATAWNTTVGTMWPALKMRTYEDKKLRKAWEEYGKDSGVSYATMYRAIQDMREFESDRDAEGNAISGSLKAKYVDYIQGLGLTQAQEKAVWEAAKNSSWSDKGTPWG